MSWLKTVLGLSDFWLRETARREDGLVLQADARTEMLASTGALLEKHLKLEALINVGLFENVAHVAPDARQSVDRMIDEHHKAAQAVATLRQLLLTHKGPIDPVEFQRFRVLLDEGHRWVDTVLNAAPPEVKKALQEYDRTSSEG